MNVFCKWNIIMQSTGRDLTLIIAFGTITLVCLVYGVLYDGGVAFLLVGYFGLIDLVGRVLKYRSKRNKTPNGEE